MIVIDTQGTANEIYKAIQQSKYSIRDIAESMGFSTPQAVYKWVTGKGLPSLDSLVVLAYLTGKKMDDLIVKR